MIIATAGHVDHGKTTLVKALTGIDTDRLPEEKQRGMSIDFGIAHWKLSGGPSIGFIDVPGHVRYIHNMLGGSYAIDHLLLVVAADDGIMPQTREHLRIATLLGINEGTVVLTKADRVDSDRINQVSKEIRELLIGSSLWNSPIVVVSSTSGQGLDELKSRLIALGTAHVRRPEQERFARFVVDRSFVVPGSGTIAIGTLIAGTMHSGDVYLALPARMPVRARKLEVAGRNVSAAGAVQRCAINLPNVSQDEIGRGSWIVSPAVDVITERLDVAIEVSADAEGPLRHWTPVHLHIGSADISARVGLRGGDPIRAGGRGYGQLRLQRPVHALHGDRFILRDQSALSTLGGGRVLDPTASGRRARERQRVWKALDGSNSSEILASLLTLDEPVSLDCLAQILNRPLAVLEQELPKTTLVVSGTPTLALSIEMVDGLGRTVREVLRRFHEDNPTTVGMDVATLHRRLDPKLPLEPFVGLLRQFAEAWAIVVETSRVRLSSHDSTNNVRDIRAWSHIVFELEKNGVAIPSVREIAAACNHPPDLLRDLLFRKSTIGSVVKITPERFAMPSTFCKLIEQMQRLAESREEGFTAAEYRDRIGTGRSLAIEILECMDQQGLTVRKGNLRTLGNTKVRT